MSTICSKSQRPVSFIDAINPSGIQLLNAIWRSPDRVHQIGIMDRQNHRFHNLPVKDAVDAMAQAQILSGEGKEVYFAPAEYKTPDNRVSANVAVACAFWVDVDCCQDKVATGKGYRTVEDAEEALRQFCFNTCLPAPTTIVHSGGGLHVYWMFDGPLSRDAWLPYSRKLKELTKSCKFLADPSRTADIASVLRLPGTYNYKYSPPRPVTLQYASAELIDLPVMLDAIDSAHDRLCDEVAAKTNGRSSIASNSTSTIADVSEYGPPNLVKLASALVWLDPDCDEETWKLRRLAPLALAAQQHSGLLGDLYELARLWSSGELCGQESMAWTTPGGNGLTGEEAFDGVWLRFLNSNYFGTPITLGTIYYDATQEGWVNTARSGFHRQDHIKIITVDVKGNE